MIQKPSLNLTVVIPGLAEILPEVISTDNTQFHFLQKLIKRATQKQANIYSYESLLLNLFGFSQRESRDVPIASIMYPWDKGESQLQSSWVIRADPVHLHPDRDELVLFGPHQLVLNKTEALELANHIAPLCTEYDWNLEVLTPDRWYLTLPQLSQVNFTSLSEIEGKYIGTALPTGAEGSRWCTLLNEIQMTLYNCSTNQKREVEGKLAVNSLWFWGAEKIPEVLTSSSWNTITTGKEPFAQALASYSDLPYQILAEKETGDRWVEQLDITGNHLLILDQLLLIKNQPSELYQALLYLEEHWFSILYKLLQKRPFTQLNLYPLGSYSYSISWPQIWYFWRSFRKYKTLENRTY
ncbi:hypothetical protein [Candidatus Nitrosacidococcus sp. I8]|uniref:hypothetical protein n=1 Tax=Candidatus Nitrosacidococcus sp. I8 TaxID=2942908 RepID=UPI0022276116|nr:hypothetical protein [Candidatus Nitrosacidococcus sp. I8]CAH9018948.1 hypothetical protein NURINAE_01238 [Candidatus Nitrosacidococcus sp. I8]